MSNDRQLTALLAQLRKIPSSADLAPEDIRQAVNQVEQEAKKILRTHGAQWPKAHERIGAGFVSGELALFEQEVGPNRVRQKPLRDDLRPYVEALALAWHARVWVDADLLPEARRALLAARERIEGARDRAAKAKRQASNAGKAKRGKLLPHNQLIHRALIIGKADDQCRKGDDKSTAAARLSRTEADSGFASASFSRMGGRRRSPSPPDTSIRRSTGEHSCRSQSWWARP